jgi:hypothetical protein
VPSGVWSSTLRLEGDQVRLTAQIKKAADGWLDLRVVELPELEAHAHKFEDIPGVVRDAAARLTGRPVQDFDVEVRY